MKSHPQLRHLIAAATFSLSAAGLFAGDSGSNSCNVTIPVCNQLAVSGTAVLTVPQPSAGAVAGGSGITDSSDVTFRLTTNQSNMQVTVASSANPPTGVTLGVLVSSNTTGLTGNVSSLTTSTQALIAGISNVATNTLDAAGIGLTYTLTLTAAATDTTTAPYSPTITYTLTTS
jgi:hypothetical protein